MMEAEFLVSIIRHGKTFHNNVYKSSCVSFSKSLSLFSMFLEGARLSASAIIKSFPGTWEIVYLNLISLMRNRCNLGVNSSKYSELFSGLGKTDWACERFSDYLIGKIFHIETDYKPLVSLLGNFTYGRIMSFYRTLVISSIPCWTVIPIMGR
jgi:hypothetical protein